MTTARNQDMIHHIPLFWARSLLFALTVAALASLVWDAFTNIMDRRDVVRSFTFEQAEWNGGCLKASGTLCKRGCDLYPADQPYKAVQFWNVGDIGFRDVYWQFSKKRGSRPGGCTPFTDWSICSVYGGEGEIAGFASHKCGKTVLSKRRFTRFTPDGAVASAAQWQRDNPELWQERYGETPTPDN